MTFKLSESPRYYVKIIIVSACYVLFFRSFETIGSFVQVGFDTKILGSELLGLIYDLTLVNSLLLIVYPVYCLLAKISQKASQTIFILLIFLISVAHLSILSYFFYQHIPLDTFVYQYSFQEILFTVKTSGISIYQTLFWIATVSILLLILTLFLIKRNYKKSLIFTVYVFVILSIPTFIGLHFFVSHNHFSTSKSFSFYINSIRYFNSKKHIDIYTEKDSELYQSLFPTHEYLNQEYPLIHRYQPIDSLSKYFNSFDTRPNIVVLLIEGLSDDFIRDYHNVKLMPFLDSLTQKSLYWNHCFTLGERSFAVVPSLLGGLPYGDKGFTLIEKLPRHLSLVSLLRANNYFTSFYYGQGGWFHLKDRFFKYNDINLVFEKSCFDVQYEKIIIGDDNFVWGYNDKDLFRQAFDVLDTLSTIYSRLDIYFTGSSHVPFVIDNEAYYEQKLNNITANVKQFDEIKFFQTYKTQLMSLLFVDDALREFFQKYAQRTDYENTLFIITGDHPMSEIPSKNALKKYHVPLLFFSTKLRNSKTFDHIVSHLDVYETILPLLDKYAVNMPDYSASLGSNLFLKHDRQLVFMNENRLLIDYYVGDYFLSNNGLYKVKDDLSFIKTKSSSNKKQLKKELESFRKTNAHICNHDKIISDSLYLQAINTIPYVSYNVDSFVFEGIYPVVIPKSYVRNETLIFDISFDYNPNDIREKTLLVYELSEPNGKLILWQSMEIENKQNYLQLYTKIPKQQTAYSTLIFKSYLWNKSNNNLNLSNIKVILR